MRVVVTGGRYYTDREKVFAALDELRATQGINHLAHGDCRVRDVARKKYVLSGADRWADEWAKDRLVPLQPYPANWSKYGNAAGPLRNSQMLTEERPDIVVAFPGGRGTADCVRQAKAMGITVLEIEA